MIRRTYVCIVRICGPKPLAQYGGIRKMMRGVRVRDEDPGWLCNRKVKTCKSSLRFQIIGTNLKPEH